MHASGQWGCGIGAVVVGELVGATVVGVCVVAGVGVVVTGGSVGGTGVALQSQQTPPGGSQTC